MRSVRPWLHVRANAQDVDAIRRVPLDQAQAPRGRYGRHPVAQRAGVPVYTVRDTASGLYRLAYEPGLYCS